MKPFILIMSLTLLTSCATIQQVADTTSEAVVEVQDQHTPEEWLAFYEVLTTVSTKAEELAFTKSGARVFASLSEAATARAENWEAKIEQP